MLHFTNDYQELFHDNVLKELSEANNQFFPGYGFDKISLRVNDKVREFVKDEAVNTYFLAGGTITNLIACSAFLLPYESIIAADTAHINTSEAGALEATGHKILTCPNENGKLTASAIKHLLEHNKGETSTKPRLVFLSNASEAGTVYNRKELEAIHQVCQDNNLLLFIDGARLGFALASEKSDLSLELISKLTDVFYIGGTKNGAMYGEALVISNPDLNDQFIRAIKNRGGLLAKTYAVALQFEALFNQEDRTPTADFSKTLYMQNARHADAAAQKLADAFLDNGYKLSHPVEANLVFVELNQDDAEKLSGKATFEVHDTAGDIDFCRFVCTYKTSDADIKAFRNVLEEL